MTDDQLLNSNRYGAARGAYREVQERHAEIQKIEKTLTELAQMFNEMAMLVEQQDEAVAQIETQAQGVDHDIKEGYVCPCETALMNSLSQTNRAVESARKARRKKWICFLVCSMSPSPYLLYIEIEEGSEPRRRIYHRDIGPQCPAS